MIVFEFLLLAAGFPLRGAVKELFQVKVHTADPGMLSGPSTGGDPGGGLVLAVNKRLACVSCSKVVTLLSLLRLSWPCKRDVSDKGADTEGGRRHASSASDRPKMALDTTQNEA